MFRAEVLVSGSTSPCESWFAYGESWNLAIGIPSRELTYLISHLWKKETYLENCHARGDVSSQKSIEIAHEMGIGFFTNEECMESVFSFRSSWINLFEASHMEKKTQSCRKIHRTLLSHLKNMHKSHCIISPNKVEHWTLKKRWNINHPARKW